MKIGLYFGSFNPIHNGHLIIASHFLNETDLEEIWFVISPQNPFKETAGLLHEQHRYNLVKTALEGETRLKASNIEFKLPRPSYTIDTLTYLHEKHPQHEFSIVMGSDGFQNIRKWKNAPALLSDYRFYIYLRPGYKVDETTGANIQVAKAPLLEISSTHIRALIRSGKHFRFLVPDSVKEEIDREWYYRSASENPAQ